MRITFEIGGIAMGVEHDSPEWDALLRRTYGSYITGRRPEYSIKAKVVKGFRTGLTNVPFSLTRLPGGAYSLRWYDTEGIIDPLNRTCEVTLAHSIFSISNVLRNVEATVIHSKGGLMVHSASFIRGKKAYIFPGVSTAGKSTLARLTVESRPECELLTDEVSLLRKIRGNWTAYGTPFRGEIGTGGRNVSAPVAKICFIAKGLRHSVRPLGRAEAYSRLVQNTLHAVHDKEVIATAMEIAADALDSIPAFELRFKKDAGFWELL